MSEINLPTVWILGKTKKKLTNTEKYRTVIINLD